MIRKEGESIKQWLNRIRARAYASFPGEELEAAVVTATPTGKGRLKMLKKEYKDTRKEERAIRREIDRYDYLIDQDKIDDLVSRITNLKDYRDLKQKYKSEKDLYRSNNFLGIGDGSGNALPSQLYRYWSRHWGYQKKHQNANSIALSKKGTDIIDLGKNVIRLTPNSTQKTALFNEFVESQLPSIHRAEKYQNGEVQFFGDKYKIPTDNISLYAGVEDGKFKIDSLFNFNKNTNIYPARNVKANIPKIHGLKIEEGAADNENVNRANRNLMFYLDEIVPGSGVESAYLTFANRKLNPEYYTILRQRVRDDMHNHDFEKTPIGDAINAFMRYQRITPFFRHLLGNKYVYPSDDLQSLATADESKIKQHMGYRIGNTKYRFIDGDGNEHNVSDYDAGILDNKTVLGNPNGGVFIGRIQDISNSQLDSLNNYLSKNPSWLLRPDLGSFDRYRLNSPSLETYLKQFVEHPNQHDPNIYTVGTTEDNKLWNK